MSNNIIVGIFGPPHSGKSVFINYLYTHLPHFCTAIVRTAPDGEGIFSNNPNQNEVQLMRKKGAFTTQKTDANLKNITNETASIVIVDTGGKFSKENDQILNKCTHSIVLSNNIEDKQAWEKASKKHNLDIIASLDSSLEGEDEIYELENSDNTIKGKVTNLNRGMEKQTTELLNAIKVRIITLAKEKNPNLEQSIKGEELLNQYGVVNMLEIADELNMQKNESGNVLWDENRLQEIISKVSEKIADKTEANFFEARVNWLVGATTEECKKANIDKISYYDARTNKFNEIVKSETNVIQQSKKLNNNSYLYDVLPDDKLKLIIKQTEKDIFMNFELNTDIKLLPEDMKAMQMPDININKNMYISGKMPTWLLSQITLNYDNLNKYVLQPGRGFFKYASQDREKLGEHKTEIEDLDFNQAVLAYKQYCEEERNIT